MVVAGFAWARRRCLLRHNCSSRSPKDEKELHGWGGVEDMAAAKGEQWQFLGSRSHHSHSRRGRYCDLVGLRGVRMLACR